MKLSYIAIAVLTSISTNAIAQQANQDEPLEIIEVAGIRSSLDEARNIKRLADTVVDAISAEDIGLFTDDSIAQAIQRIPGVQIETDDAGTDGDRVSIRGLGPEFVNSTINGRILLSSGNEARSLRKMNFNVFPPSILSGVEVSKGQTAVRPESGLAGQVNLQTLRPLDSARVSPGEISGNVSARYEYEDLADGDGYRFSGLIVGKNEASNLGGYFGLVSSESEKARDQARLNRGVRNLLVDDDGDGVQDSTITGASVPLSLTLNPIREVPERTAIAAGLQYQSDAGLEVVWDFMYSRYNNESDRDQAQFLFGASYGATVFSADGIGINDQNLVTGLNYAGSTDGGAVNTRVTSMQFDNDTENLITGLNFDWSAGNTTFNADVYYSEVDYTQDLRFTRMQKSVDKQGVDFQLGDVLPSVIAGDITDVEGFVFLHSIVRFIDLSGNNYGLSFVASTDLDSDFISSVDYGVSYSSTEIDSRRTAAGVQNNPEQSAAIAANALDGQLTPGSFLGSENFQPSNWLQHDIADTASIDPYVTDTEFADLGIDPAASHFSEEAITALFGQVNIDTVIGDTEVTGNAGVRAVYTDHSATAGAIIDGADPVDVTTGDEYWEILPSVNLKFMLQDNLALRTGLSKTLSRPDYEAIAPIINVFFPEDSDTGTATAGNSDLAPMTSNNFDITLEYYNDSDGAAVMSIFYKDVKDFIISQTIFDTTVDGFEGQYNLTTPINFSDGEAQGVEVGIYQPFDKLFPAMEGFGVSANYTYVDSSFDKDVGDAGFGFPGSSQDNFNFIGFYENQKFSARVAYVYRGDFFRSLAGTGSQTDSARFTEAAESLDVNLTYRPNDSWIVQANVSNLTNEPRRDFVGYEQNFLDYYERGRQYSATVTYKF